MDQPTKIEAALTENCGLIRHCVIAGTPLEWLPDIQILVTPIKPQVIAWVTHNEAHRKTCAEELELDDGPQIGFLEFCGQDAEVMAFLNRFGSTK